MHIKTISKLLFYSFLSRVFFLILSLISSKITVYDHSTELLNLSVFSNLIRWDALYFYEIAKSGYSTIQQSAFFPLFPFIVYYFNVFDNIALSGIILSNFLFICNSVLLYNLLVESLISTSKNEHLKNIFLKEFLIVYCFYPTTIINSSFYSESMFFFLILIALNILRWSQITSYIFIILSCLCRSNGLLFSILPLFISKFLRFMHFPILIFSCKFVIDFYQIYIYKLFKIRNSYYFVQTHIWDQGFLKFYNFRVYPENIINLCIGLPFIYTIFKYNLKYWKTNKKSLISSFLSTVLFIQIGILILFFHLQIFMRFVSTNPLVYLLMILYSQSFKYFSVVYSIWYCVLFSCYYPPT